MRRARSVAARVRRSSELRAHTRGSRRPVALHAERADGAGIRSSQQNTRTPLLIGDERVDERRIREIGEIGLNPSASGHWEGPRAAAHPLILRGVRRRGPYEGGPVGATTSMIS